MWLRLMRGCTGATKSVKQSRCPCVKRSSGRSPWYAMTRKGVLLLHGFCAPLPFGVGAWPPGMMRCSGQRRQAPSQAASTWLAMVGLMYAGHWAFCDIQREKMSNSIDTKPSPSGHFGRVPEGSVRVGPIAHLGSLLVRLKLPPEPLFERFGVSGALFSDPENTMAMATLSLLLDQAALDTSCPHLGLLLGQESPPQPLGLLSEVLPHCPDVGTALTYLLDYFHLHDRGAMPTLSIDEGCAFLGYTVLVSELTGFDHIQDAALAIGMNIMRTLCGPQWKPRAVRLARRRPANLHPYQTVFQCPLAFNCEHPTLVLASEDLEKPIPGADVQRFQGLHSSLETIRGGNPLNFAAQVQRAVQALLVLRCCSLAQVAKHLAMNRRSLNRRLAEAGTSYRRLADEARRTLAFRLMRHTDLALSDIAVSLDYGDASAFSRAFQRWQGVPPSEWRRRQ